MKPKKPMLLGFKIFIALGIIVFVISPLFEVIFGRTELTQSLIGLVMVVTVIVLIVKHYRQKKEYKS